MKKTIAFLITLLLTFPSFPQVLSYPPDALNQNGESLKQDVKPTPPLNAEKDKKKGGEKEKKTNHKVSESKVSVDFRETDIKEVARAFSKISGVSILVSEGVKASVTANIEGLPWEEALDLILKTHNLAYTEEKGFLVINTYQKLQGQEQQVPLKTQIITLNFVKSSDAKKYIGSAITRRGTLAADPRTNSLVINDTPTAIEKAIGILKRLDTKTPQVLIEVLMVDRKLLDYWDIGIDWDVGNTKNSTMTKDAKYSSGIAGNLPLTLHYGIASTVLNGWRLKDIALKMRKDNKNSNIIANPRILTLDNKKASIDITNQVPYTRYSTNEAGNTTTATEFKDVGIKLDVTPHITSDNHISMDISTEQSFVDGYTTDNQPITSSRKSRNEMMIKDRQTIVIGGLRKREKIVTTKKVPILGDIPFLKRLFSSSSTTNEMRELLIFVTPHVIKESSMLPNEGKLFIKTNNLLSDKFITAKPLPCKPEADKKKNNPKQTDILNQKTKSGALPLKADKTVKVNPETLESAIPQGIPDFRTMNILPLRRPNE